jgi:hypothetical protein
MIFLPARFIRREVSDIDRGTAQTRMAWGEFPDQKTFKTPLKRSEQEVDSRSACDEEKHFGERHGVGSAQIVGLSSGRCETG